MTVLNFKNLVLFVAECPWGQKICCSSPPLLLDGKVLALPRRNGAMSMEVYNKRSLNLPCVPHIFENLRKLFPSVHWSTQRDLETPRSDRHDKSFRCTANCAKRSQWRHREGQKMVVVYFVLARQNRTLCAIILRLNPTRTPAHNVVSRSSALIVDSHCPFKAHFILKCAIFRLPMP